MEQRKHPRLKHYDYSGNGAYFVTFCTKNRACLLWESVGRGAPAPPPECLSEYGRIVDELIQRIPHVYPHVLVPNYVVMPNHVHLLVQILDDGGAGAPRPTVMAIVGGIKSIATRKIGHSIWQPSFHDHIVRSEQDFLDIWNYITGNPSEWSDDIYYEP